MKGLAELKNKVVKAPHLNIFKIGTWVTMGLFATTNLYICGTGDVKLFSITNIIRFCNSLYIIDDVKS